MTTHAGELAGTHWDPGQYSKFAGHRLRPALELLDRIPLESPRSVVDLGCGTGNVTRMIAARWSAANVTGIDNSPEMLDEAGRESSGVRWVEADIAAWRPDEPPDVIYSNAALHWLGDHDSLFPRLLGFLAQGGCLAVQMPVSWHSASHVLMRETLARGGAGGAPLGTEELRQSVGRRWVDDAPTYYDRLASRARSLDIWETEYLQVLEGEDPVLEWTRGTGLRPVLKALDEIERETFLAGYRSRLREAYPTRPDGRTLYPFRRLFIVAVV